MKKTTQLRRMIESPKLELLMEAHHALSAKIVENAGFKGIWASGLSMSCALGVRDNNEASWTQILEVLEFMSDATTIPILLDGDTGYGNFNNARRLVKKLEQRGIAGVCIEDKLFPKTNSFIQGEAQPLADIEEFCYKIQAMKDTQEDDDFVVVARVEALIAGWGLREALRRAEAYHKAGADAILVHSKKSTSSEIEAFMKEWADRLPVVVVPTKYYTVSADKLREMGISVAIWANHNLRAYITAMEKVTKLIYEEESICHAEKEVAPLEKVFALQNADELIAAEKKYLPQKDMAAKAVILVRRPDTKQMLKEQIAHFQRSGIKQIHVLEPEHKHVSCHELSLLQQESLQWNQTAVISFSDIYYKPYLIQELLSDPHDIIIIADADSVAGENKYFVTGDESYSKFHLTKFAQLKQLSKNLEPHEIHGEFIGLWKVSRKGAELIKETLLELAQKENAAELTLSDLFQAMMEKQPIAIKYIKGQWLDYDEFKQWKKIGESHA